MVVSLIQRAFGRSMLLLALLPLFSVGASVAAPAVLTQVYNPPYAISAAAEQAVLQLPVTVSGARKADALCVEKVGARYQNLVDADLSARFRLERTLVDAHRSTPLLRITVDKLSTLAPGEYQLMLRVFDCTAGAAGETIDTMVVPVTRPYVRLETPSKVVLERWLYAPWSERDYRHNPERITLRPQDDHKASRIMAPKVEAGTFTTNGGSMNVGAWTWRLPAEVGAGEALSVELLATGFPVGVASGQFVVSSNDLQTAARFDVEVRSRLQPVWIILAVAGGVLAGWLLRIYLRGRVELAMARQSGLVNLQRYRAELDGVPDATFQAAIRRPVDDLMAALNAGDKTAIDNGIGHTATAVDAARLALNAALTGVAAQISQFRNSFDVQTTLPTQFVAVSASAMNAADACAAQLQPPNPTAAQAELERQQKIAIAGLGDALTSLKIAQAQLLAQLGELAPLLDATGQDSLAAVIDALQASLLAIATPREASAMSATLQNVLQQQRDARLVLERHASALDTSAARLDARVAERAPTDRQLAAPRAALRQQIGAIAEAVRNQAHERPFDLRAWPAAVAPAAAAIRALLLLLLESRTDLSAGQVTEVRQALASGDWNGALDKISPRNQAMRSGMTMPLASPEVDQAAVPYSFVPAPRAIAAPVVGAFSAPHIGNAVRRNQRQLDWSECLVSSTVALLLAAISFALYEDRFIGTWGELLGLFAWGFSTDLTVDKLTEKLAALGPR